MFEKAIELDQVDPLPRLGLGLAKIRDGDLLDGRREIDIAVSLDFYARIADFVRSGFDSFALTRRNISSEFRTIEAIPNMYEAPGTPQRGPDCFVFARNLYAHFQLDSVFIGQPGIGRVLLANLIRFGKRPGFFTDAGLTFHIGNDGLWKSPLDDAARVRRKWR